LQLLADMSEQVKGLGIGRGGCLDEDGEGAIGELWGGFGHLAIEGEGEVGVEFLLEEIELGVGAVPGAGVPDDEGDAARGLVDAHGIDDIDLMEAHGVEVAGAPWRASFSFAPAILTVISLLSLSIPAARCQ